MFSVVITEERSQPLAIEASRRVQKFKIPKSAKAGRAKASAPRTRALRAMALRAERRLAMSPFKGPVAMAASGPKAMSAPNATGPTAGMAMKG